MGAQNPFNCYLYSFVNCYLTVVRETIEAYATTPILTTPGFRNETLAHHHRFGGFGQCSIHIFLQMYSSVLSSFIFQNLNNTEGKIELWQ